MAGTLRHWIGLAAAFALLPLLLGCGKKEESGALMCYVGGTMRPAIEELARKYEEKTGQHVDLNYGDSGTLLVHIETTGDGDLYVCHDPFSASLEKKNLARQIWTVATLTPTIAVPKGNPKHITGLLDLAKPGIKLGLTDEMYSTLGHICPVMFAKTGVRKAIEANVVTRERMGGAVANSVMLGHLDATIVWNAVIFARQKDLDAVEIEPKYQPDPKLDAVTSATFGPIDMSTVKVTISTLAASKKPTEAAAFAEFANSPEGRAVFAARGFSPAPGTSAPAQPKASTASAPK